MAKVMIIAGGDWQVPLVCKAKELGHKVLCTNLYENSPAFQYADEHEVADVLDRGKNLEIAKRWKPDVILTDQSDIAVPTVAYICDALGLQGIGRQKAALFTNKYEMRMFEANQGFCHPFFCECRDYTDAVRAFEKSGLDTAIIKPVDSQSSRGVYKVSRGLDFLNEYEVAKRSSHTKRVIFEEFIDGVEFTVDGLMLAGEYHTLAISRKKHYAFNSQIASDLFFSWDDPEYDYKELEIINKEHIVKAKLPFGLTHSEYKYYKGTFYLIEMAARGGGTLISSDIAPYMSGIDGPGELIRFLTKEDRKLVERKEGKIALLHFLDIPEGRVREIEGSEHVRSLEGIHKLQIDFQVGDYIRKPDNDRGRVGFVIIFGNSRDDIEKRLTEFHKSLKISIESFERDQ